MFFFFPDGDYCFQHVTKPGSCLPFPTEWSLKGVHMYSLVSYVSNCWGKNYVYPMYRFTVKHRRGRELNFAAMYVSAEWKAILCTFKQKRPHMSLKSTEIRQLSTQQSDGTNHWSQYRCQTNSERDQNYPPCPPVMDCNRHTHGHNQEPNLQSPSRQVNFYLMTFAVFRFIDKVVMHSVLMQKNSVTSWIAISRVSIM